MERQSGRERLQAFYREEISRRSPPKSQEDHFMLAGYQRLLYEIQRDMDREVAVETSH